MDWGLELCTYVLRILHVIAAIGWYGSGLWVNRLALRATASSHDGSEVYATFSLGVWRSERIAQPTYDQVSKLIWSFNQAKTLFISGALLFLVLYWLHPEYLSDASGPLTIARSVGGMIAVVIAQEALIRLRLSVSMYVAAAVILLAAMIYLYVSWFNGRGAMMQVGAMLGCLTMWNVLAWLRPRMRRAATLWAAGDQPPEEWLLEWKRRTLQSHLVPGVIVLMLSSHFPLLVSSHWVFAIICAILFGSAWVRQMLVHTHRNGGRPRTEDLRRAVLIVTLILAFGAWNSLAKPKAIHGVDASNQAAMTLVHNHCASCHSQHPTFAGMIAAPKGVQFDTLQDLKYHSGAIEAMVVGRVMPPGNVTHLTDHDRQLLIEWAHHELSEKAH